MRPSNPFAHGLYSKQLAGPEFHARTQRRVTAISRKLFGILFLNRARYDILRQTRRGQTAKHSYLEVPFPVGMRFQLRSLHWIGTLRCVPQLANTPATRNSGLPMHTSTDVQFLPFSINLFQVWNKFTSSHVVLSHRTACKSRKPLRNDSCLPFYSNRFILYRPISRHTLRLL